MSHRRLTRMAAMTAALGVVLGLGLVAAPASAPRALAAVGDCPDGSLPGPGSDNEFWTDQNVAVYAGQDFTSANTAAEVEGLLVVGGDAVFTKTTGGTFNVGWAGVGSGVGPHPGTVMLAVGGDVSVGEGVVLDVGSRATDENGARTGGDVQVGGITTPDYETDGTRYELNNGTLTQEMGPSAIAEWATWGTQLSSESAAFAALSPTGSTSAAFGRLTLTGDGTSNPQVFSVEGAVLETTPEVDFVNLSDDVPVIINVTGTGPVTWAPYFFMENGDLANRVDAPNSPRFGPVSQRTLWNFTQSTSVHIDGSSQVLGSILVPGINSDPLQPTLRVTASTNGRLYTNGSILMDGFGNEHHNYPWIAPPFDCIPVDEAPVGQITVEKVMSPEGIALLPPGTTFHGIVTCPGADGGELIVEWEAAPGGSTVVAGLPVGETCVIEESLGAQSRAYLLPTGAAFDAPRALVWEDPTWYVNGVETASPVTFVVPAPEDAAQITVSVGNVLAVGSFTITKTVQGDNPPPATFTGTWSCEAPEGTVLTSGQWSLTAGQTTDPIAAPVGSLCAITEADVADPANGSWAAPVLDPASVVITPESAETPLAFTVTNTFSAVVAALGSFVVEKVVDNPDDVAFAGGFEGSWSCTSAEEGGDVLASGDWSVEGPGSTEPIVAPVGSWCSVTEVQPTDPAGGTWTAPVVSPGAVLITAESIEIPLEFTVVNTLTADEEPGGGTDGTGGGTGGADGGGGTLPVTGGQIAWWAVGVGAVLLIGGAVVVAVAAVRRRRS